MPPGPFPIDPNKLYPNGVNAVTGEYLIPATSLDAAAASARGAPAAPSMSKWLKAIWQVLSKPHLGLPLGVHPEVVEEAGWGVVFHEDEAADVKTAIGRLVAHRATRVPADRIKTLVYKKGWTAAQFLAQNQVASGSVEPTKVPYYLLLVGGPERIPFSVGHLLDVEYATGRLAFDAAADYDRYITSLIAYEAAAPVARRVAFFSTSHDAATFLATDQLVKPLTERITQAYGAARVESFVEEAASKEALKALLSPRPNPPSLLFTASHGLHAPAGDPTQRTLDGALLCQEWSGGIPTADEAFAAADLPADAAIHGLVAFHFACFSAGTPQNDRFLRGAAPVRLADADFLAALPRALLARADGALAVIGHVDQVWSSSFLPQDAGRVVQPFENAIKRILLGQPIGHALRDFRERYASISTQLSALLEQEKFGTPAAPRPLATAWLERNDAEGYVVLGDPAAQQRFVDGG